MKTHLVFCLQGFEECDSHGNLSDVTEFQIIAKTEKEAREKAEKIKLKKDYRVYLVIEKETIKEK